MEEILKGISEFVDGCLGPLGSGGEYGWPDWIRDFFIQILATLILFLIVRHFLWKPVTALLEARKNVIDKELIDAKEHRENAVKLEAELQIKYDECKAEIQRLLKQAEAQGNQRREEIIAAAKDEANRRIKRADEEIAFDISQQKNDIKNQIVEIAFLAAETIVGHEVDKTKYLSKINEIIDSGLSYDE